MKANNVFVKADYSGQELRVLAEISQDRRMINAFNNNEDLHLVTANRVFGLDIPPEALIQTSAQYGELLSKFKVERYKAKNGINFPIIYGAWPKSIAEAHNVSIKEAQRWLNEFHKLYPGVQKAIDKTKQELWNQGYVTTLMGRRRRFPQYKNVDKWEQGRILRQAFNFKIQGFSADMIKIAANKISKILSFHNAKIVLSVHDELVYELQKCFQKEFAEKVKEIMENCVSLSVPIIADVNIVKSYGE